MRRSRRLEHATAQTRGIFELRLPLCVTPGTLCFPLVYSTRVWALSEKFGPRRQHLGLWEPRSGIGHCNPAPQGALQVHPSCPPKAPVGGAGP